MNQDIEIVKERQKVFTYTTSTQWIGDEIGSLHAEGKNSLTVSSPPEFKGTPNLWTPEEMFVGAIEMCHMLTFLTFARKRRLNIQSYSSRAEGRLELVDGAYRFTHVTIMATIRVGDPAEVELVQNLVDDVKDRCLISNSVSAAVSFQPALLVR